MKHPPNPLRTRTLPRRPSIGRGLSSSLSPSTRLRSQPLNYLPRTPRTSPQQNLPYIRTETRSKLRGSPRHSSTRCGTFLASTLRKLRPSTPPCTRTCSAHFHLPCTVHAPSRNLRCKQHHNLPPFPPHKPRTDPRSSPPNTGIHPPRNAREKALRSQTSPHTPVSRSLDPSRTDPATRPHTRSSDFDHPHQCTARDQSSCKEIPFLPSTLLRMHQAHKPHNAVRSILPCIYMSRPSKSLESHPHIQRRQSITRPSPPDLNKRSLSIQAHIRRFGSRFPSLCTDHVPSNQGTLPPLLRRVCFAQRTPRTALPRSPSSRCSDRSCKCPYPHTLGYQCIRHPHVPRIPRLATRSHIRTTDLHPFLPCIARAPSNIRIAPRILPLLSLVRKTCRFRLRVQQHTDTALHRTESSFVELMSVYDSKVFPKCLVFGSFHLQHLSPKIQLSHEGPAKTRTRKVFSQQFGRCLHHQNLHALKICMYVAQKRLDVRANGRNFQRTQEAGSATASLSEGSQIFLQQSWRERSFFFLRRT